MSLFKISTLALTLALTGWAACGSSSNNNSDVINIGGTGGTSSPDAPPGTGGSSGTVDAPAAPETSADTTLIPDTAVGPDAGPLPDTTPGDAVGLALLCAGLTADQCHLAIINAPVDPTVSALDPGPNPTVGYPICAAQ